MKIYTKTGDKGETGIVGNRILKNNIIIETIGNFDELNATLGIVIGNIKLNNNLELQEILKTLLKIQDAIFEIGSILANTNGGIDYINLTKELENEIDILEKKLPTLKNFILPGGSIIGSFIHLSRTVCRRAERSLVSLTKYLDRKSIKKDIVLKRDNFNDILIFTNRLSDYLFVLARYINHLLKEDEIIWNKDKRF